MLAAPISTQNLVVALALPTLALALVWPLVAYPLAEAGYRLGAGQWAGDGAGAFVRFVLAAQVAGVWLAASGIASLFAARSQSGFMLGLLAGYGALVLVDSARVALLLIGMSRYLAPLLLASLAAGLGALRVVAVLADRESLLGGG